MQVVVITASIVTLYLLCGCSAQRQQFAYEQKPFLGGNQQKPYMDANQQKPNLNGNQQKPYLFGNQNLFIRPAMVPECPLEIHPDTETMFIMRNPLGDPEPRTCPPGTYFLRSVCSCVNRPLDIKECNLRPSALGSGWYEENVFGVWVQRPCGPGSAYNPSTCDCSFTL